MYITVVCAIVVHFTSLFPLKVYKTASLSMRCETMAYNIIENYRLKY